MAVGDITSTKRGTGCRYNDDKPPVELLDLQAVALSLTPSDAVEYDYTALFNLAWFQEDPADTDKLYTALTALTEERPHFWWFEAAKVMGRGAEKYAPWNWAKGMPWSVVLGCAVRHLLKAVGEGSPHCADPESGLPHRAHAICNLMFLAHYTVHFPEGNDLYMGPDEEEEGE